jgi:hypothetical protein
MIERFRKITDGLYRGSAPSENDVKNLHKYLNIKKIVSLDKETGEAINNICNNLGIEHIIIPLNGRKGPLAKLMSYDLYDLLMSGGPTYIHCMAGKDRTGLVSAMFKCLYMDWTYDQAMQEAKSLGFGVGVSPFIVGMYSNILKKICQQKEESSNNLHGTDIVHNERNYKSDSDGRGSYLDQAHQGSFAPYLSKTRQYPYDNSYNPIYDQSPTRYNYPTLIDPYTQEPPNTDGVPMVGYYNTDAGVRGFGPAEPYGGFIYD